MGTPILDIYFSKPDRPEHEILFMTYAIELIECREKMIKELYINKTFLN